MAAISQLGMAISVYSMYNLEGSLPPGTAQPGAWPSFLQPWSRNGNRAWLLRPSFLCAGTGARWEALQSSLRQDRQEYLCAASAVNNAGDAEPPRQRRCKPTQRTTTSPRSSDRALMFALRCVIAASLGLLLGSWLRRRRNGADNSVVDGGVAEGGHWLGTAGITTWSSGHRGYAGPQWCGREPLEGVDRVQTAPEGGIR